ncbi:hypothetical protein R3P38DRAFT_3181084 [Favolaschia claudopus]|uniref:Uncharacterized protein n=1 Tax=Favolaschia claudopus TaxID=2862362 RepID=A0AAW0CMU5_9AGAR
MTPSSGGRASTEDYGKRCALNSPLQDVSAKWLSPSTSDLQRISEFDATSFEVTLTYRYPQILVGWVLPHPDPETKSFNWSVCTVTGFLVGLGSGRCAHAPGGDADCDDSVFGRPEPLPRLRETLRAEQPIA